MNDLLHFYYNQFLANGVMGFVAKIPLVAAMLVVYLGLKKPGAQLLTAVVVVQLVIAGIFALLEGGQALLLAGAAFLGAVGLGNLGLVEPRMARIFPENEHLVVPVGAGYLVALFVPIYAPIVSLGSILQTPFGLLPQVSLVVAGMLLVASARPEDSKDWRIWFVVVALLLAAAADMMAGVPGGAILLLITATAMPISFFHLGGSYYRHSDRVEVSRLGPRKKAAIDNSEEDYKPKRKWNIN